MTALPLVTLAAVSAWLALVVVAQLANPEQSAVSLGMSGLARGRSGWIMRLAFLVRGLSGLALAGALSQGVADEARPVAGIVLLLVWGGGSALLAAYDTDLPGEAPTPAGRIHALIALVAYVAVTVGMVFVSWGLTEVEATAGVARWAQSIALFAAVAMVVQFAGFAAAARSMDEGLGRYAGLLQRIFIGTVMLWTALVAFGL